MISQFVEQNHQISLAILEGFQSAVWSLQLGNITFRSFLITWTKNIVLALSTHMCIFTHSVFAMAIMKEERTKMFDPETRLAKLRMKTSKQIQVV